MNKKLQIFINLSDLPKIEEGYITCELFLDIYQKILLKGGDMILMAQYVGRSRRTVKKKLKYIIKQYNEMGRWRCVDPLLSPSHWQPVKLTDVKDLEKNLKSDLFAFW